jgi:hypothetical protein
LATEVSIVKRWIKAILMVLAMFMASFVAGCAAEKTAVDYFPAKVGSRWVFAGEGNEYAPFTREVTHVSGNRVQIQDDNGGTIMASVYVVSATEIKRVFKREEAYDKKSFLDEKENASDIILKLPPKANTSWDNGQATLVIESADETVTVPAGAFAHCLKLKISSKASGWITYEWYAPGVGLVKRESGDGQNKVVSSLKSSSIVK